MDYHLLAYYIGIFIVIASHAYILYKPNEPLMSMQSHSYLNIFAGFLIAYYFMHKEEFIQF